MNKTALAIISIIAGVLSLAAIVAYVANFSGAEISRDPAHWGVFGDYLGGVLNPLLALITLLVTVYIANVANRLEEQSLRSEANKLKENARPVAQIFGSDYENKVAIVVKNIGIGPFEVNSFKIWHADHPDTTVQDLVDLMPALPDGLVWRDFNINGIPPFVYQQSEVVLLKLEGDPNDQTFRNFRDEVRERLRHIFIELKYSDIYGNPKPDECRRLTLFDRHFS